jgi:hypothetical protein
MNCLIYLPNCVYDVMEAGRYPVKKWLFHFIEEHVLPKNYFFEQPNGVVRLTLKLTPLFCETITEWEKTIEPVIAQVRKILSWKRLPI